MVKIERLKVDFPLWVSGIEQMYICICLNTYWSRILFHSTDITILLMTFRNVFCNTLSRIYYIFRILLDSIVISDSRRIVINTSRVSFFKLIKLTRRQTIAMRNRKAQCTKCISHHTVRSSDRYKTLDVAKTFTKKKKKKNNRVLVAPIATNYYTTARYYVRYVITSYE